ncbi:hypothetical protein D9M71_759590 [compost metagenome]
MLDALIADVPASAWKTECSHIQPVADIYTAFEPETGRDPLAALDALTQKEPSQVSTLQRLIAGERP